MPELPEVETVRRQLDARLAGRIVQGVDILRSGREFPAGEMFIKSIEGKQIDRVERRAKVLAWRFVDGFTMLCHLKMTGKFLFVPGDYVSTKHDRILFRFNDETVVWNDVRQFGYVKLFTDEECEHIFSSYGPEPLEASEEMLAARLLSPKTRTVKTALLDQTTIAGVGNIYADEACHRAGIRPTRRLGRLTKSDRLRLSQEVRAVLAESIALKGTSANDYVDTSGEPGGFLDFLRVYGRSGEPCRTCLTPITKIALAGRGTHYCPRCQR